MTTRRTILIGLALGLAACEAEKNKPKLTLRQGSKPANTDRLAKGEKLPGRKLVFGLEVPRWLTVTLQHAQVAQLSGHRSLEEVTRYFQRYVSAAHIEATGRRVVFPKAFINALGSKRLFRIEIAEQDHFVNVRISEITPPNVTRGISEKERWKRAGRNSDGSLRNRKNVF